jgi:hypothetical protein
VIAYNRTVNNFGGVTITNVYEKTVIVAPGASRVSFNGGSGGITLRPRAEEEAAAHGQHVAAIPAQLDQERTAGNNRALLASENCGQPPIAATAKPGEFTGKGVVAARSAEPTGTLGPKPIGAAGNPTSTAPRARDKKETTGKSETTLKSDTPVKPLNTGAKPLNTEAKPTNTGKTEPLNTERKPLSTEAKLPNKGKPEPLNTGAKPKTATSRKASNPVPQVATGSGAHSKPSSKDKKPPG